MLRALQKYRALPYQIIHLPGSGFQRSRITSARTTREFHHELFSQEIGFNIAKRCFTGEIAQYLDWLMTKNLIQQEELELGRLIRLLYDVLLKKPRSSGSIEEINAYFDTLMRIKDFENPLLSSNEFDPQEFIRGAAYASQLFLEGLTTTSQRGEDRAPTGANDEVPGEEGGGSPGGGGDSSTPRAPPAPAPSLRPMLYPDLWAEVQAAAAAAEGDSCGGSGGGGGLRGVHANRLERLKLSFSSCQQLQVNEPLRSDAGFVWPVFDVTEARLNRITAIELKPLDFDGMGVTGSVMEGVYAVVDIEAYVNYTHELEKGKSSSSQVKDQPSPSCLDEDKRGDGDPRGGNDSIGFTSHDPIIQSSVFFRYGGWISEQDPDWKIMDVSKFSLSHNYFNVHVVTQPF